MVEEKNRILEKLRLDKAYINYQNIIDKKLPYKYAYLDEWLLKSSQILVNETTSLTKTKKLKTYQRGTIVKVDFGVGIGSEMSQIHFAIVLNNYDNPKNNILTVVPLTSKYSQFNTYLGTLVIDLLIKKINCELETLDNSVEIQDVAKLNKLRNLIKYYKSNVKSTYACCSLITTISKERIFLPVNEYDIIGRAKCSNEIMNKIDEEIKHRFTKV